MPAQLPNFLPFPAQRAEVRGSVCKASDFANALFITLVPVEAP